MSVLGWVVFGALAGWIASLVIRDDRPRGCLTNMVTGVVGALLGGFVYRLTTGEPWTFRWNWSSFGVAVLGAVLLLLILNLVLWRSSSRR